MLTDEKKDKNIKSNVINDTDDKTKVSNKLTKQKTVKDPKKDN